MIVNRYGNFVFAKQKNLLDLIKKCGNGVNILSEEENLEGYQLYIVEQWACDRGRPYNTIVVFTGDPTHKVKAFVVNIEDTIESYPEQLKQLFDSLEKDNTTGFKEDYRGTIFVTNLSTFPSLNIILVPDGDYEANKLDFFLNLNLRKAGCSGRSALSLKRPTDTQKDKFIQTYTVSNDISFDYAVLELVKLVQISLYMFGYLSLDCTDGFLCDSTEKALGKFQNIYCPGIEIRENNLLDPTLVAVILRMIVSIRNKLNSLGYQVGKDPFSDNDLFLNGVVSFQKSVKVEPTRELNFTTVEKIYEVYNRSRNTDGIKVHKVLKSKFDDMSKSTGSSSMTADFETCDLDEFGKMVQIERLKYLWRGKGDPPEQFSETHGLFHGSRDFGKELGKSFLRGVSGRTAKTGEAIRDGVGMILEFKDGVTGFVDKRMSKDREKIAYGPIKSSSLPACFISPGPTLSNEIYVPYDLSKLAARTSEPRIDSEWADNENSQTKVETYSFMSSETELPDRNETNETRTIPRSNSLSTFDFITDAMSARVLPIHALKRYNSFTNIDLARKQADGILPRRTLDMDIQTYMVYENLRQKESSLKSLVGRLEFIVEEYNKQIEELAASYEERSQSFKSTETEGNEALDKQRMVSEVVTRIDNDSAKLNYRVDVLEDKLREIEEFVDTFCLKVQILESKMPQSSRPTRVLYNLWSYFQDQWKGVSTRFYKKPKEE